MTISTEQAAWFRQTFDVLTDNIERAVLGKRHVVRLTLTCLLSEGHLLLEDFPGTGKTMLAQGAGQHRAGQPRPDPVHARTCCRPTSPASRSTTSSKGSSSSTPARSSHSIVLADEINRASPKTQSALLEVMEEGRVTVDGVSRARSVAVHGDRHPEPDRAGRHLPAARGAARPVPHEDRVGYPDHDATVALLVDAKVRDRASLVTAAITAETIAQMSSLADEVHVDPAVLGYVAELAEESRRQPHVKLGVRRVVAWRSSASPRPGRPPTAATTWCPTTSGPRDARAGPPPAARRRGAVRRRHGRDRDRSAARLRRAPDRPGRLSG